MNLASVRDLAEAGALKRVIYQKTGKEEGVLIINGRVLQTSRNRPRHFPRLESAVRLLMNAGLKNFHIRMSNDD